MILKLATVKSLKADVLRISPSSERLEELWVVFVFVFICRKWSFTVGENMVMTNSVASFSAYQHTHNPTSAFKLFTVANLHYQLTFLLFQDVIGCCQVDLERWS